MKHEYALDFAPPFVGLDNELYNTFRLGTSWSKRLAKGDEVYIQSSKDKLIFSKACMDRKSSTHHVKKRLLFI